MKLQPRQILGYLTKPDVIIAGISPENNVAFPIEQKSEIAKLVFGDNFTHPQRIELSNLVSTYRDVFAANPQKLSRTNLLCHKIITPNVKPAYGKPRRIPWAWEKGVDIQVREMLQNNIIRESKSPWNAPILLVKKKDQTVSFCL